MSDSKDGLGQEVAISAKLDGWGLTIKAKSRAVSAFDRLIGSLIDIPAAYAEGIASKKRIRDQVQQHLLQAQGELAEQRLRGAPVLGDAVLYDILKDAARKQANTASVALDAMEALKALPPPPSGEDNDAAGIADDWMNQYVRFAEDASSEDLQQLWGRVLAGEIRAPGSFSRHTLRFIAELDEETARNCEFAREHTVGAYIPSSEIWQKSPGLNIGLDLQRLGLVEGVGALPPQQNIELNSEGYLALITGPKCLLLRGPPGTQISFPAILLTRIGSEIFSLLTPNDPETALRGLAASIRNSGAVKAELGNAVPSAGTTFDFFATEVLWDNAPQ